MAMSASTATSGGLLVGETPVAKISPRKGEKKSAFIGRCISTVADEGVTDNDQRVAMCSGMWESSLKKQDKEREFSTTLIALTGDVKFAFLSVANTIPDEDLHPIGREDEPHVTVKFGTHTDDAGEVADVIEGTQPFVIMFGKTSIFEVRDNQDEESFDVVKVEVSGPGLFELNERISAGLMHTDTRPGFVPHATLAYVKPGLGEKYEGLDDLDGLAFNVQSVVFSGKSKGDRTTIPLGEVEKRMVVFEAFQAVQIEKADSGDVFLEGAVLVPEQIDNQNDIISSEEIRKSANDWMRFSQHADLNHEEYVDKGDAYLVENRILKRAESFGDQELPVGTWVVKFEVLSDELKQAIAAGDFTGFSICGHGQRE